MLINFGKVKSDSLSFLPWFIVIILSIEKRYLRDYKTQHWQKLYVYLSLLIERPCPIWYVGWTEGFSSRLARFAQLIKFYIAILNHLWISYSPPFPRGGLGWGKKFTTPARFAIEGFCRTYSTLKQGFWSLGFVVIWQDYSASSPAKGDGELNPIEKAASTATWLLLPTVVRDTGAVCWGLRVFFMVFFAFLVWELRITELSPVA